MDQLHSTVVQPHDAFAIQRPRVQTPADKVEQRGFCESEEAGVSVVSHADYLRPRCSGTRLNSKALFVFTRFRVYGLWFRVYGLWFIV
jgi:hypothetical protein